jgi:antitoxin component of MazEF toxin-antitoxin module
MPAKKTIQTMLQKMGNAHCIAIPAAVAESFAKTGSRRVLCTINGSHQLHAALQPRKAEGDYYIYAGKALLKQLGISAGSKLKLELATDESAYQFAMPEELAEVLATDEEAHTVFHRLTPGNQRGLIHLVAMVKSADKRIERALKIAEKIKSGITSPPKVLK